MVVMVDDPVRGAWGRTAAVVALGWPKLTVMLGAKDDGKVGVLGSPELGLGEGMDEFVRLSSVENRPNSLNIPTTCCHQPSPPPPQL